MLVGSWSWCEFSPIIGRTPPVKLTHYGGLFTFVQPTELSQNLVRPNAHSCSFDESRTVHRTTSRRFGRRFSIDRRGESRLLDRPLSSAQPATQTPKTKDAYPSVRLRYTPSSLRRTSRARHLTARPTRPRIPISPRVWPYPPRFTPLTTPSPPPLSTRQHSPHRVQHQEA